MYLYGYGMNEIWWVGYIKYNCGIKYIGLVWVKTVIDVFELDFE